MNTAVVRQMDTHQAQDKVTPASVNLTIIVIQVSILCRIAVYPIQQNLDNGEFKLLRKLLQPVH
ncbi:MULTISPECIES: hypothetical protein [unclassified Enterobacter]|uniref:hypothetical protein n=1 Tax=unclassified Enterobacter TaxID=2608935 RepID=UPI003B42EF9A